MTANRVVLAFAALGLGASLSMAGCLPRPSLGDEDGGPRPDAGPGPDGAMCPAPIPCPPCFHGYVTDSNGCLTCQCEPPPPNADCALPECGPAPGAPTRICPDGKTTAGPVCVRDPSGACGWHFTDCPPQTCTPDQCTGPMAKAANFLCSDGKTVAGPACLPDTSGTGACAWTIVSCPPTCVDNVLCVVGYHFDTTACQCVPDMPPPDACGCADGQLCVTQIGGPALPDPIPVVCQSPDPVCAQAAASAGAAVSPCVCLPAGDGPCTQTGARSCTCDNGIR